MIVDEKKKQQQVPQKKQVHPILFILCLLCSILFAFYEYLSLRSGSLEGYIALLVTTFTVSLITYIACGIKMAKSCWQYFHLIIILDKMMMMYAVIVSGIVGMTIINTRDSPKYNQLTYANSVLMLISCLLMIGAYRTLIVNNKWRVWQIIVTKLALLIAGLGFLVMATDIILNEWAANEIKDFVFMYVFGLNSMLIQIYGKFTEFDGTGEMVYDYHPITQKL